MVNLGILGFSPANGHPYSFSSIINGYDKKEYLKTEWTGILDYLEKREVQEIADLNAKVTHIWTQNSKLSEEISKCSYIENISSNYHDMIGVVDGIIIARDDYEQHKELSKPFLEAGIPVFIDKPLTLDKKELNWYRQYYDKGLLMSCSGLRYCKELEPVRIDLESFGSVPLVRAAVINGWQKYGIHMLDATLGIWDIDVESIRYIDNKTYDTFLLEFVNGMIVQIDNLGPDIITFSYEIFGSKKCQKFEIRDNFSSFKNTLSLFINQVKTRVPAMDWSSMNRSISILIAGNEAKSKQRKVEVFYE